MSVPAEGVHYGGRGNGHIIVVVLTPDEADSIASALAWDDKGGDQLREWAEEARRLDR